MQNKRPFIVDFAKNMSDINLTSYNKIRFLIQKLLCLISQSDQLQKGHSMSDGPKFQRLGHDPSQILMKLFQMKGTYEIRLP